MSNIKVGLSIKKNLGNYQMLDIIVGLEKEVQDGLEEDPATWEHFWSIIDAQLEAKLIEVDEAFQPDGKK